ncbi:MAG TPA: helix-turn-helix domain-containing protein [Candidatus Dojkabacteria bacterium]|nr:helix-turn-helix domain-containing protein [Candidatus Dojkabacteria bacterium]
MENLVIVPKESLESLQSEIKEIKSILQERKEKTIQHEWLTKKQARERLHVCLKTFDNYLKKNIIPHSRFAGKIYVKASDIQAHLEKHYITN